MGDVSSWLRQLTGMPEGFHDKILVSLAILLGIWVIRLIVVRIMMRRTEDVRSRYLWQKTASYLAFALSVILIARLWFQALQDISTFLGLLSAGIAIALKDIVTNIAGWVFLIWVRPLTVGDRIQLGGHAGDVIDISLFHITLLEIGNWVDSDQSTGRIIKIPNGMIFRETFGNYGKGFQFIWNEIPVLITFESDWEKAKRLLLEIVRNRAGKISTEAEKRVKEASMRFLIFYSKLTPTVYTTVKEFGVLLTIRYLCEPRLRRDTQQEIWEDILHAFADCADIDFAYPTRRMYNNVLEGKPETRRVNLAPEEPEPSGGDHGT